MFVLSILRPSWWPCLDLERSMECIDFIFFLGPHKCPRTFRFPCNIPTTPHHEESSSHVCVNFNKSYKFMFYVLKVSQTLGFWNLIFFSLFLTHTHTPHTHTHHTHTHTHSFPTWFRKTIIENALSWKLALVHLTSYF
jgi:hypothetical protein